MKFIVQRRDSENSHVGGRLGPAWRAHAMQAGMPYVSYTMYTYVWYTSLLLDGWQTNSLLLDGWQNPTKHGVPWEYHRAKDTESRMTNTEDPRLNHTQCTAPGGAQAPRAPDRDESTNGHRTSDACMRAATIAFSGDRGS